jgi:hypothetical protein
LVSKSGIVNEFTWEFIPPDSLYLKMGNKGIMLRHGFIFDAILVMQVEGSQKIPMIFYNEKEIPDGDLSSYIIKKMTSQFGYKKLGENYYIKDQHNVGLAIGTQVLNKDLELVDMKGLKFGDKYFTLKNGIVTKCEIKKMYRTNKGVIFIRVDANSGEMLNAPVTKEVGLLLDGVYIIKDNAINKITIKAGKVFDVSYTWYHSPNVKLITITFAILFILILIASQNRRSDETSEISPTQNPTLLESESNIVIDTAALEMPAVDNVAIDTTSVVDTTQETEGQIEN